MRKILFILCSMFVIITFTIDDHYVLAFTQTNQIEEEKIYSNNIEQEMQIWENTENTNLNVLSETSSLMTEDGFLYKIESNSTITITGYNGTNTDLKIPSSIEEKPVAQIGNNAFENNCNFVSIEIPDSVQKIGSYAFSGCMKLEHVIMADSVLYIGDGAFKKCISLEDIRLSNGLSVLNSELFQECINLKNVVLPQRLKELRSYAFDKCEQLTYIDIPETATAIGSMAFKECKKLKEVKIPDSIIKINSGAFYGCAQLERIALPSGLTNVSNQLFSGCKSLKTIQIPNRVQTIGDSAFLGCIALERIEMPNSVVSIGNNVFYGCESLFEAILSENIVDIGEYAFHGAVSLKSIKIPDDVMMIRNGTFYGCENLESVYIPNKVKIIDNSAFYKCFQLKQVMLPDSVTEIGYDAFGNCRKLEKITFSNRITSIGQGAFEYCTSLKEIMIPEGLTRIEEKTFADCDSLTSVVIPSKVTSIGVRSFYHCDQLEHLQLPEGLLSIESGAFLACRSLKDVKIPRSVNSIEDYPVSNYGITKAAISVYPDSYAHQYMGQSGIPYRVIGYESMPITNVKVELNGMRSIQLSWQPVDKVDGYLIYRNDIYGEMRKMADIQTNSYLDKNLLIGKDNTYQIYTYRNYDGMKILSMEPYVVSKKAVPEAVKNLKAVSVGTTRNQLTWDCVEGASGYLIYRQDSKGNYGYRGMVRGEKVTSYTDTTAETGAYNFYWVFPYKDTIYGMVVGETAPYVYAKALPAPISNLKASSVSTNTVKLSWDGVSDVDGYIIYRQVGNGKFEYRYIVKGNGFVDTSAVCGEYNYYRIYPYKLVNGKQIVGASIEYKYAKPVPKAVTNLKISKLNNYTLRLVWDANSDVDGYIIYRQAPGESKMSYRFIVNGNSYNDTGLYKEGIYYYRVYAYKLINGKRVISLSNSYVYAKISK